MPSFHIPNNAYPRLVVALLIAWCLLLNLFGLGDLEFLRHTEADRTLIAWHMLESGNYLVPHLLNSPILTKPPLFYWLLSFCFALFGQVSECLARLPSALLSVVFVLSNYVFLRRASWRVLDAAAASFVLSTSLLFFNLSVLAEIDLTFGFLCSLSFYAAFFAMRDGTYKSTLSMYAFAGLAFLTKGPPIVFFLAAAWSLSLFYAHRENLLSSSFILPRLKAHCLGLLLCMSMICAWLIPLAQEVGVDTLLGQFEVEVLDRVISEGSRERGFLYYGGVIVAGLVPWCAIVVFSLPLFAWREQRRKFLAAFRGFIGDDLLRFHLAVVLSALVMLTIAEGKSSRYLFPVLPLCANLLYGYLRALRDSSAENTLFKVSSYLFPICPLVMISLPLTVTISGVTFSEIWWSSLFLALALALLAYASLNRNRTLLVFAFGLCMLGVRFGQANIYAPHRNSILSVKAVADEIVETLPKDSKLYVLEMYERWLTYYLKKQGRESYRLRPSLASDLAQLDTRIHVLLNMDELWREQEIRFFDPTAKFLGSFHAPRSSFLLYELAASTPLYMELSERFPSNPRKPHPLELEFYRIINTNYP
jgi:4-amino-4-deoxy-L-arabinose transferase-like glycosyltransferase